VYVEPPVTYRLHVSCGRMREEHASHRAFFMVRGTPGKLTVDDLDTELDCGLINEGPSLSTLEQVSRANHVMAECCHV
jgi:hypothetical protein